jgi:hypothetical protein
MRRDRTAELAKLAQENGFTTTELHRAMLGGATILLHELATGAWGNYSDNDRRILLDLAAALEHVQVNVTFIEGVAVE